MYDSATFVADRLPPYLMVNISGGAAAADGDRDYFHDIFVRTSTIRNGAVLSHVSRYTVCDMIFYGPAHFTSSWKGIANPNPAAVHTHTIAHLDSMRRGQVVFKRQWLDGLYRRHGKS